jgi:ABC-type branched-subunit amino acid transport system permease subunit
MIIFALMLILLMIFRPKGLFGDARNLGLFPAAKGNHR